MSAAVFAAGAGALLYGSVLLGLVRQWSTDPAAAHGWLLAAAGTFLLWRRWPSLRTLPVHPSMSGAAVAAAAMALYLAGSLAGDLFVQRVSLPLALTGAVMGSASVAHARAAFAPLALLALAIPLPAVFVQSATLPLQLVSSQIAADMLQASSVNVVLQGNLLVLDRITLEVAEACSGLQSLLSLFSVAAVASALLPINAWGRATLFAAVLPVAIIGNGLRVAATGLLTTWMGEAAVRGLVHEATGYAAFLVMCAGIFALLWLGRFSSSRVPA